MPSRSRPILELPTPPQGTPKFRGNGGLMSPGSSIAQAARAVAENRGGGSYVTAEAVATMASGRGSKARVRGNLEVLSDTQGVDFGPYLERVLQAVRMNWYNIIPEEARPPLMKKGKVAIEFAIIKDGKVAGMSSARARQAMSRSTARPGAASRRRRLSASARRIPRSVPGAAFPLLLQPRQRAGVRKRELRASSREPIPFQSR